MSDPLVANTAELLQEEHRLTRLIAMSFDGPASPSISLRAVSTHEPREKPYGWGFAWYPEEGPSALLVKDPTSIGENAMTKLLREWERFESTAFICHVRGEARALKEQDTQPFLRSYAGRDWVFAHNGDLTSDFAHALPLGDRPAFEPAGRSDSEHAFCWLLEQLRNAGARRFADYGYAKLHGLLRQLDELGTANFLITDGLDVVAYRDESDYNGLAWTRILPPQEEGTKLNAADILIDLEDATSKSRSLVVIATAELEGAEWQRMIGGQLLVIRRGAVVFNSHPGEAAKSPAPSSGQVRAPLGSTRRFEVLHETVYTYERPVELSEHTFRLRPVHDLTQRVLSYDLQLSVDGLRRDFEDVFGNQATHAELEQPYGELRIASHSLVELTSSVPVHLHSPQRRFTVPLVWMPWQRQMMQPYLLTPELPESQLNELYEYAMSFVRRQEGDLIQTLMDMNQSICRDFKYLSGSTTLATSAFDVYAQRVGVCQDFANLLICLVRLLGVPARYRVGYIFTGGYENREQGDASHAWAELYLPWMGWQGFDPTNGSLAGGLDHVRVACGRNYRDATPTSGTLYKGGGDETMKVTVRIDQKA